MKDEKYQGWTNWETWAVNLWLTNDQGSNSYLSEIANDSNLEEWEAPDILKDWVEEINPVKDDASLWSDLISGCLSEVNWDEIVEAIKEEN